MRKSLVWNPSRIRYNISRQHEKKDQSCSREKVWFGIPQEYVTTLVDSMRKRIRAVVEARGGSTRY